MLRRGIHIHDPTDERMLGEGPVVEDYYLLYNGVREPTTRFPKSMWTLVCAGRGRE